VQPQKLVVVLQVGRVAEQSVFAMHSTQMAGGGVGRQKGVPVVAHEVLSTQSWQT
jgi:hypothetical protein